MLDPDRIEERRGHAGNHEEFILVVSRAAVTNGTVGPCPQPYFDRKSNPISTRGTDYAHRINTCPRFSDLPTALSLKADKEDETNSLAL